MINSDGLPNSIHMANLVAIFFITKDEELKKVKIRDEKLVDVSSTILEVIRVEKPEEMDGEILLY